MPISLNRLITTFLLAALPVAFLHYPEGFSSVEIVINETLFNLMMIFTVVVFLVEIYFGNRINQNRVVVSATIWLFVYLITLNLDPSDKGYLNTLIGLHSLHTISILSLSVPIALIFIFLIPEGGFKTPQGILRISMSAFILFSFYFMVRVYDGLSFKILSFRLLRSEVREFWTLPDLCLFVGVFYLVYFIVKTERDLPTFSFSMIFSMIPFYSLMNGYGLIYLDPNLFHSHSSLHFIAIGLIQIGGLVSVFWKRMYLDELTGIANRRALNEKLKNISSSYILAMVDVDHFKKFNDEYGHKSGDEVLRFVAKHFHNGTRGKAYRYGGEEFCVVYEKEDMDKVKSDLDHLRETLSKRVFYIRTKRKNRNFSSALDREQGGKKKKTKVTVSIGIACSDSQDFQNSNKVQEFADKALYKAKKNGRNRIEVS